MKYEEEIDVASAKERFMGNEALYKKFLYQLPEKNMMEELQGFLGEGNVEAAFRSAHTMKGVVGNLSLNRLMADVSTVVEILRAGNMPEEEKVTALKETYAAALAAIDEIKAGDVKLF